MSRTILAVVVISLFPIAQRANAPADEIGRIISAYKALPQVADRTQFDVQAKAAALPANPDDVFAFVRDQIVTDIYAGVLRGAAGTLQAGSGNDLDKSLLLGALLAAKNQTFRYAHCTLPAATAAQRVAALFGAGSALSVEPDVTPALKTALRNAGLTEARSNEIATARQNAQTRLDASALATARADLETVRRSIATAGIVAAPRPDPSILADAQSHYWLQVNRSGSWIDLDSSVAGGKAGASLCAPTETYNGIPDQLFQTVTLAVRNEYLEGESLRSEVVLTHRVKASDLFGQIIFYDNLGVADTTGFLGSGLLSTSKMERFRPFLRVGQTVFIGKEYQPLPSGAAFADALGGGPDGPVLLAQWIDFTFEAPSRKTTESRALLDFVRPEERSTGKVESSTDPAVMLAALEQGCAIAVTAGRVAASSAIGAAYQTVDPQAATRVFGQTSPDVTKADVQQDLADIQQPLLGALALAHAVAAERALLKIAPAGSHLRVIRHEPMVTIANMAIRRRNDGAGFVAAPAVDLRHDVARVVAESPEHAIDGFWANALHGLIDGAIERTLPSVSLGSGSKANSYQFDTSSAIELARKQGIELRAVAGSAATELLSNDLGEVGGVRLLRDVPADTAIITPVQPVVFDDEPRLGLWTLDRHTGRLLALIDTGLRGVQTAAERNLISLTRQLGECLANTALPLGTCAHLARLWRAQAVVVLAEQQAGQAVLVNWDLILALL